MGKGYTESQFASQVEHLLNMFNWHWCHFRPARTEHGWRTALSGKKGLPDYIAVRPPRLLFFELKSEKGAVLPEQEEWMQLLRECQMVSPHGEIIGEAMVFHCIIPEVYLWRPGAIEEIAEILSLRLRIEDIQCWSLKYDLLPR